MADTLDEMVEKINKNFPDTIEKCQLICTLLGTAANLSEYIMAHHDPAEIPLNIQYCVLVTSTNMMGLLADEVVIDKVHLDQSFKLSEQCQEHIYRKMKYAVDVIIKSFKQNEAENVF